jgi:uncharacterized protein DUF4325
MSHELNLSGTPFYGTRFLGRSLRSALENLIGSPEEPVEVRINFASVGVTQSFLDEFLGVLVVNQGQPLVDRLIFTGTTKETRALLGLVIGARLHDRARLSAKTRIANYSAGKSLLF